MKSKSVSELKANLSGVLKRVQMGESFVITYGRNKRPIAKIVPIKDEKKSSKSD